jgi:hypothetical protein
METISQYVLYEGIILYALIIQFCLFIYFHSAENQTQDLVYTKQVIYHWDTIPILQFYFSIIIQ